MIQKIFYMSSPVPEKFQTLVSIIPDFPEVTQGYSTEQDDDRYKMHLIF